MIEGLKNLLDAIDDSANAKDALWKAWHYGPLRKLLVENLRSKDPIFSAPSEEFPRVRSYRGTGPKCELVQSTYYRREKVVRLEFAVDYVEEGVDIFMESEGCPGAEVQTVQHEVLVPEELVKNPTKQAFGEWVKKFQAEQASKNKGVALEKIRKLAKANGLTVSVK